VRAVIEHFAAAPAPPSQVEGGTARPDGVPLADGVPLLAGVAAATRRAIGDRGVAIDVAAGNDVTRRWDSDRCFYLILTGRYDVFIDSRLIRTLGPGDHFGELAARDWGGGYGYARLATVRCAEPGRLIRLASEDLEWLTSTEPAVKARLATTLADRLQNR
jgi:uridine kinase